jgi:hypothetical protein
MAAPRAPAQDLWPAIAQRIARVPVAAPLPPRRRAWPEAVAAMLVLGVAGFLLLAGRDLPQQATATALQPAARDIEWTRREVQAMDATYRAALAEVEGQASTPPALRGAITELDAAQAELEGALRQSPDSPYLLKLLQQTHERRLRLSRHAAGVVG